MKVGTFSAGCTTTASNLPPGGILYGKADGYYIHSDNSSDTNTCNKLGQSQAITFNFTWHYKSSSGVVLARLAHASVNFSGFDFTTNGASEPGYEFPQHSGGTATATGSFAGSSSELNAFAEQTTSYITKACAKSTGLRSLQLGAPGPPGYPSGFRIG